MRPIDVNTSNEAHLLGSVYKQNNSLNTIAKRKFNVGDIIRISKYKSIFEKGYTPNWSTELFKVDKILPTNPYTYIIRDLHGQRISGSFYEYELQKSEEHDVYLVEKELKKRDDKVYVKWLGFDNTHNSWINKSDIIS